ncbi:hypothetical protein PMZ80_008006 [Knufia obscura]|uniref:Uncharacterized protein n=1 Tax=Knufia obscura TaxID=1635080 RepID=A0ABR0RG87_9EURO|nr:hypothetical protein PMZ80_008006 [Knufia obscura]
MGISRAAQSPTLVHRSFRIARPNRRDVNQVRTLWWWTQKRRGWLSSEHDDMEEKLRRHQALMMHRYSKSMRRRSLWDRDDSPKSPSWRVRGCNWGRDMSSTRPQSAKVEERDTNDRRKRQAWQGFHKDFESFKRAVDEAIERDPVGTLFGRRLRSPNTSNNSAWTSWSWIFDPKEIKEDPKPDSANAKEDSTQTKPKKAAPAQEKPAEPNSDSQQPRPSVVHSFSPGKTATSMMSSHTALSQSPGSADPEYVYDPISGRKVPQNTLDAVTQPVSASQTPAPAQTPSQRTVPPTSTAQVTSTPSQPQARRTPAPETKPLPQLKPAVQRSFVETMFGEHGVDLPVKTYKPPKVYGYTGEPKPAAEKKPKERSESTRKREYDLLRLRTIGNNIDATNFNCEPWNNKQPDPPKVEEVPEPVEKPLRTSSAPGEDAPLFSGTIYQSKADETSPSKSDWLAKEGFGARQGLTMPSLKENEPRPVRREPAVKMEPALDRRNTSAADIPVKKFGSKLQPAMDRIVPPAKSESSSSKPVSMQASTTTKIPPPSHTEETVEDMDLLRASDVRATAKAARITKQEIEDKKKEDRRVLEKDFEARSQAEQDSTGATSTSLSTSVGKEKIAKHIKQYPDGIVARTMKSMGIMTESPKESVQDPKPVASASATKSISVSNATIKAHDIEAKQFEKLASDLKDIYRQSIPEEDLQSRLRLAQPKAESDHKPSFSQPTVKPGVVRDLAIERHTKDFEPKIANIVDKAKSVKRELHDVRLGLGDVINERAITALANRDLIAREAVPSSIIAKPNQQPAPTQRKSDHTPVPASKPYDSPSILLIYNETLGDVEVKALNSPIGHAPSPESKTSPMAAIGSLKNPNAFVKHFADLDKNGYELISGGGDILVFQKRQPKPVEAATSPDMIHPASTSELRSTIAAAEAAAQPAPKTAANVLDELPTTVPTPGPAAPTAPTSTRLRKPASDVPHSSSTSSISNTQPPSTNQDPTTSSATEPQPQPQSTTPPRSRRSKPKVSRQEQVFSGQIRLPPQTTALPDPEHFQKANPTATATHDVSAYSYASSDHERPYQSSQSSQSQSHPGFFARLRRGVRRVVLTALAFGAGAYGIGVVAEGVGARRQVDGGVGGPMKRIVMEDKRQGERQRSGIFSTESSR